MCKDLGVLGSAAFFVLAPGILAGLVSWWISRQGTDTVPLGWPLESVRLGVKA
jgi:hypothetical protein